MIYGYNSGKAASGRENALFNEAVVFDTFTKLILLQMNWFKFKTVSICSLGT